MNGPSDPLKLASRLGVSPMAVRQHLYALRKQRLVTYRIDPRPLGRPAKSWRLAPSAEELFPDRHGDLCVSLLDSLSAALGQKGLDRILEVQAERQVQQLVSTMAPNAPLPDRLKSLVRLRTDQGYLAELQQMGEGTFRVIENHCPVRNAAGACPGLCDAELHAFQRALGMDTSVERQEHILSGDRRCTYLITRREDPGTGFAP
jgi:predicted ArsR family transcriptional regulator